MSALVVTEGTRHGLLGFIDQRPATQIFLLCEERASSAIVVTAAVPGSLPGPSTQPQTTAPMIAPLGLPGEPSLPRQMPEYWPVMLHAANAAAGSLGFQLVVDTTLLSPAELRFRMHSFITRAVAYATEGYHSIQIQPTAIEEWGAFVLVPAI